MQAFQILNSFPLRFSITDHCNLRCFFCSNEGMDKDNRNTIHIRVTDFKYLVSTFVKHGLKSIALTGGEPTLHPDLDQLLDIVIASGVEQSYFHTNGVELTENLILGKLKLFSKVSVSIHATDFLTWKRITCGTKEQFDRLWDNLALFRKAGYGNRLEIKHVPAAGINDSIETLKALLELCASYGAKFKFLMLEPIEKAQMPLVISLPILLARLESIGCIPLSSQSCFRGQAEYLPINWYRYRDTNGVAIEIGCGTPSVCQACYKSNEIFITPMPGLKACHVSPITSQLREIIDKELEEELLSVLIDSRRFLFAQPGRSVQYWREKTG